VLAIGRYPLTYEVADLNHRNLARIPMISDDVELHCIMVGSGAPAGQHLASMSQAVTLDSVFFLIM